MKIFLHKIFNIKVAISLAAVILAGCAAFFSVTGIGALFAGAFVPVLIMASALEFGKLVSVSFLYRYWERIPRALKSYMLSASAVLIIITSLGIYGFLTAAYQKTADKLAVLDTQTRILEAKKERYNEQLQLYVAERTRLGETIQELSKGLANNTIQYKDAETGNIITTTSGATRNALQQQLNQSVRERDIVATKIEQFTDSVSSLDIQSIEMMQGNEIAGEVGPLRYLSTLTGWSMDRIVNIFILVIVFVFDPLAICMVVGYNFLIKSEQEEAITNNTIPEPLPEAVPIVEQAPSVQEAPQEEIIEYPPAIQPQIEGSNTSQYMTTPEMEQLMERWWARRNGIDVTRFDKPTT